MTDGMRAVQRTGMGLAMAVAIGSVPASAAFAQSDDAVAAQAPADSALAAQGAEVFRTACIACHGEDGLGGPGGGAPLAQVTDPALVVAMVTDGRGSMPPLSSMLTMEQIRAVAAYVTTELFK
jgi:mono/diheme cytochrome c family protein